MKEDKMKDDSMSDLKNQLSDYDVSFDSNIEVINSQWVLFNKFIGGIPVGKIVVIQALEGVGKSSMAAQIGGWLNSQKYNIIYLDTEAAMSTARFQQLGLNINSKSVLYMQPTTLQMAFGIIQNIIKTKASKKMNDPMFIIWDSLAATPAAEEIEVTGQEIGIRARVISQGLRIITSLLTKVKITLIIVNQYRMKMSTMPTWGGPQYITPGGIAPRFHSFQTIELKDFKKFDTDEMGEFSGKLIKVKALKNKYLPPLVEFNMYYSYTHGFIDSYTVFYALKDAKKIKSAGPWWWIDGLENKKFKKLDFDNLYNTDTELHAAVLKLIDELHPEMKGESIETTGDDADEESQ
ncbi:MAG: hypothetical protein QXV17_01630 [Candidatus Micrarchaeaceae archaeon]